jgi:MscS family membrane protein
MFSILPFTYNNLVQSLVIIIGFIVAGWVLTTFVQFYVRRWAAKTRTELDDMLIKKFRPPFSYIIWLFGIRLAIKPLNLNAVGFDRIINSIILIVAIYAAAVLADIIFKGALRKFAARTASTMDDALMPLIDKSVKSLIVVVGLVWLLDIWSVNIAPVLASLGIAGLALGFAVKDSLANIFGGISMILDQTIKVGDKVKLESGDSGDIVDMGLRSTKLKTFDNEIITVPNGQLANSRIQNYGQPDYSIRVVVDFGVAYGSSVDHVRKVIHDAIRSINEIQDEPAPEILLVSMGDFALNFSARFWVPDYNMQWKKKIEAVDKIHAALNKARIEIPFPTRTVYNKK